MTDPLVLEAARENAVWVDAFCRSHGLEGAWHDGWWASARRTPDFYPDAVTLVPSVDVEALLAGVDARVGCSVKDSFADLDLAAHGFTRLFDARWVRRPGDAPAPASDRRTWQVVDATLLPAWEDAWSTPEPGAQRFRPALLAEPGVRLVAAVDAGEVVAGAVLHRAGDVVGVSNLFDRDDDPERAWTGTVRAAADLFPGLPLCGYEQEDTLPAARAVDFTVLGPLTVWLRGS